MARGAYVSSIIDEHRLHIMVPAKAMGERLDIDRVSFATSHPAMLRHLQLTSSQDAGEFQAMVNYPFLNALHFGEYDDANT